MNLAFQIEAHTNVDGSREIVSVECEPTKDDVSDQMAVEEIAPGSWLFQFVASDDLEGSDAIFRRFERYGLDADDVRAACADAAGV